MSAPDFVSSAIERGVDFNAVLMRLIRDAGETSSPIWMPEGVWGNIYTRPNLLLKAGDKVKGHKHRFDHLSFFWCGRFRLRATLPNGTEIDDEFAAPEFRLIYANVEHEITALRDTSLFICIYSHRDPQGEVTQQYTGFDKAYV